MLAARLLHPTMPDEWSRVVSVLIENVEISWVKLTYKAIQ